MATDLVAGRITSFKREQGFGTITLDDGRQLKFDSSICTMVPEEGVAVRVRVGPAKWGGGEKAVHVEPVEAADSFLAGKPKPSLENQLAAVEAEHLVSGLTESVLTDIVMSAFGGKLEDATLLGLLDAYYRGDPQRATHDGYLRHDGAFDAETDDTLARLAPLLPNVVLPAKPHADSLDGVIELANTALRTAGDGRRVYALDTRAEWRAFYVLASDRAKRLAGTLPFATDPQTVA